MAEVSKKIILTAIALSLSIWMVVFGISQLSAERDLELTGRADQIWGKVIMPSEQTLHEKGLYALALGQYEQADNLFKQVVNQDLFHMESWLWLVETQAALGNIENSRNILTFSVNQSSKVMRWKWQQAILAQELGLEGLFVDTTNMLLQNSYKRENTFQLLTESYKDRVPQILAMLSSENKSPYLKWLIRWDRLEDTKLVWNDMIKRGLPEKELSLLYIRFLLKHKQIDDATEIWHSINEYREGITNGGFERPLTKRAFDWHFRNPYHEQWRIFRTIANVHSGAFALQVDFMKKENINFKQISQLIPVNGGQKYMLSYTWKSRNLTTDKGPFVEIFGYDYCKLYYRGKQMLGSGPWRKERIEIDVPTDCQAIIIRLRRIPSKQINNLISGTLWLDDFQMNEISFHE